MKNMFWNRETSVNIRDVKISEMNNFPLVFKLLLRPGYDIVSLEKEGCSDIYFNYLIRVNSAKTIRGRVCFT